jgi:tripartite-type tricarboxylate transporter receptor subunit TctC
MMTDLLGSTIPMMFINQDVALPHVKSCKLRAIAVSSAQRNALYPDVPTVAVTAAQQNGGPWPSSTQPMTT